MVRVDKVNCSDCYRFVLSPNCSFSWPEPVAFYLLTCLLGAHGKDVEVGNFLDNSEKDELAFQLKDCIIRV